MYRIAPLLVLLTACGPKVWTVEADVVFDNESGYDFTDAEVCGYTADLMVCTATRAVASGSGFEETLSFLVEDGDTLEFDAWALDVDTDEYLQEFAPEVIDEDGTYTVDVVMTLADLQ